MQASIIIPVYKGSSTLPSVFNYLELQHHKEIILEIIVVDDASPDDSWKAIQHIKETSKYNINAIHNKVNMGLAATYNKGIKLAKTEIIILMHQDILLEDRNSLVKVIKPLLEKQKVVATHSHCTYPLDTWRKNSFWQQALFSRLAGRVGGGLNGKFDCYRNMPQLIFDHNRYRTAGEDFDLEMRLKEIGQIEPVDLVINHVQEMVNNFSISKLIRKEAQLAECYGVNMRRHFSETKNLDKLILTSRILLLLLIVCGIFINVYISILILFIYSYLYTSKTYYYNMRNPKIIVLPFVNFLNLVLYNYYFSKGYLTSRQRL